ncbi:MAG: glycosyltransferase [Deltaproteobacteria bacterium]|nr:glycosyltransferase [Deltaproteobacteria bacterium]
MTRASDLKISIITPSYNQGRFLEETIQSVLTQNYPNIEYIIIDGGSTDGSIDMIHKYKKYLAYWLSEPDKGQSDAINKGWSKSTGDVLCWINADDLYKPEALKNVAEVFNENPNAIAVIGAGETYNITGNECLSRRPPQFDPYAMIKTCGSVPIQPSVFIKRNVYEEIGGLDVNLHYVMDWEYWIRIGLYYRKDQIVRTPSILSINREWPATKTNIGWQRSCEEHRIILYRLKDKIPDQALIKAGIRSSYRKQADSALRNNMNRESIYYIAKSLSVDPLRHNPLRECILFLYLLLGKNKSQVIKQLTSSLREKLGNRISY